MGSWLRAVGEASPTIRATMKDIEDQAREMRERPVREEAQRLELQTKRNTLATGNIQLEQLKRREAEDKLKYEAGEKEIDLSQSEQFKAVSPSIQREVTNIGRSLGYLGKDSMGIKNKNIEPLLSHLERNREVFKKLSGMAINEMMEQETIAKERYQKARESGKPPEEVAQLKKQWETYRFRVEDTNKVAGDQLKWIEKKDSINAEIDKLRTDPAFSKLPPTVRSQVESLYDTGDLAQWNSAMKNINDELIKAQNPSSNIAKPSPRDFTPESLANYAKSGNMNDLVPIEKMGKVPSSGNAVDTAIRRKFGTKALTDPKLAEEADKWLATPAGKQAIREAAQDVTPPSVTYLQTSEGFVPMPTRGPGVGTTGQPTGLKKPISDAQLTKVGELNAVLKNIEQTKTLYGYGSKTEHQEWVGPVAGRTGGIEAKYIGTASPEQVKFYSYIKDMQDALLRARSGAQINEQEYKRLVAFLPEANLPPVTFKAKLERFQEATEIIMDEKLAAFEKGGLGVEGLKPSKKTEGLRKKYNY